MSYYTGLGALAQGVAKGLDQYKQDTKEAEQRTYDRNRQSVADQQNTELHQQQVQGNQFKLQGLEQDSIQSKRKQYLTDQVGKAILMRDSGDTDGLFNLYGDVVNNQTLGDPKTGIYSYKVEKQPDGTANINAYDRNTGALVTTTAKGVTADHILKTFNNQIDPVGAYVSEQSSVAAKAKADREYQEKVGLKGLDWNIEQQKLGVQNKYKLGEMQFQNGLSMGRDNNQSENRVSEKAFEYQFKPQVASKANGKVAGMVQGALSYIQQNPNVLQGLSPEEQQLAIANIAIESGGNPNARSPVGATGLMQMMPIARTDVMRRGAADPYSSPTANVQGGMVQLKRLVQKYNGDMGKAIAANNWGEGNLDKHIKKYGDNWTQGLPAETANHIERFAEAHNLIKNQQASSTKVNTANLIGANVDPLTKQISTDFKDSDGISAPQVRSTLNQVSTILAKSLAASDMNERKALYSQAGNVITFMLKNSGLTPQEQYNYRDNILQGLLGESSLAAVGSKMGFMSLGQVKQAQGKNQSDGTKRGNQRANASATGNPFIDPDAELFKQAPGVDRSVINNVLRGG